MAKVLGQPINFGSINPHLVQQAQSTTLKAPTAPPQERWQESDFPPYDVVKEDTYMTLEDYNRYKTRLVNTIVIPQRRTQAELEAGGFKSWKQFLFSRTLMEF